MRMVCILCRCWVSQSYIFKKKNSPTLESGLFSLKSNEEHHLLPCMLYKVKSNTAYYCYAYVRGTSLTWYNPAYSCHVYPNSWHSPTYIVRISAVCNHWSAFKSLLNYFYSSDASFLEFSKGVATTEESPVIPVVTTCISYIPQTLHSSLISFFHIFFWTPLEEEWTLHRSIFFNEND